MLTTNERQQAAQAKREYMRKWRKRNPEKVKEAQERYWLKKAQQGGAQ
jgi:hypothetical protein